MRNLPQDEIVIFHLRLANDFDYVAQNQGSQERKNIALAHRDEAIERAKERAAETSHGQAPSDKEISSWLDQLP
jgi:hypothetical protein